MSDHNETRGTMSDGNRCSLDLWGIRTTSSGAFDRIKAGRDMARGRCHPPRADRVRWFRW